MPISRSGVLRYSGRNHRCSPQQPAGHHGTGPGKGVTIDLTIGRQRIKRLSLRLLWDLLMVWAALANLTLIIFDLTYLHLRPFYHRLVPPVTSIYDPVKGITPHPLTEQLLAECDTLEQLLARRQPAPAQLARSRRVLRRLTLQVLEEDPFAPAGLSRYLQALKVMIASALDQPTATLELRRQRQQAVTAFWSENQTQLAQHLATFNDRGRPLLAVNYTRDLNMAGYQIDRFWLLDLPFLALFWLEFVTRWVVAAYRRTYARWFFFPFFYWYDLLGLVPSAYFRPLRLLRIASIYLRLRRSKLSRVGDDVVSRAVAYISGIITEEVSDLVSLRILEEYQQEIREGTHRRIFEQTIGSRRQEIHRVMTGQMHDLLTNPASIGHFRELLRLNLETAVSSSPSLRSLPLPDVVLEPLVRAVGEILLDTVMETVTTTLASESGQELTGALVGSVLDQLLSGPGLQELDSIASEIGLDIFEHMKETVAVKKWAQAERPAATGDPDLDPEQEQEPEPEPEPESGQEQEQEQEQDNGVPLDNAVTEITSDKARTAGGWG